jgi:hypothetical protein
MCCQQIQRILGLLIATAVTGCAGGDLSLPNDGTPARMIVVSGDSQAAAAGSLLPDSLVVQLTDAGDNPVAQVPLVFHFVNEIPNAEILPAAAVKTDSTGQASVQVRLGTTTGDQTVEARIDAASPPDVRATFGLTALKEHGRGHGGGGDGD